MLPRNVGFYEPVRPRGAVTKKEHHQNRHHRENLKSPREINISIPQNFGNILTTQVNISCSKWPKIRGFCFQLTLHAVIVVKNQFPLKVFEQ
jgi:hypothetical protein